MRFEILCCSNLQIHVLVLQTGATFFEIFSLDDNYVPQLDDNYVPRSSYHPVVL